MLLMIAFQNWDWAILCQKRCGFLRKWFGKVGAEAKEESWGLHPWKCFQCNYLGENSWGNSAQDTDFMSGGPKTKEKMKSNRNISLASIVSLIPLIVWVGRFFKKIYLHISKEDLNREKEMHRKRKWERTSEQESSIWWFTPQIASTHRAGPEWR